MISIIIPTFNDNKRLYRCIDSILNGKILPEEIIVINDGSYEKPVYKNKIVTIVSQKNKGPASARNHGARLAKSEYIYFIDSDCWTEIDTLERIKISLQTNPKIAGLAGPYKINYEENFMSLYSNIDLYNRYKKVKNSRVQVHGTYNLVLNKTMFDSIGGFDENFPRPSGEDFDLVSRFTKKFGSLIFKKQIVVNTNHEIDPYKYLKKQFYRGLDRAYLYKKNRQIKDYYTSKNDLISSMTLPIIIFSAYNLQFLLLIFFDIFFNINKISNYAFYIKRNINFYKRIKFFLFNSLRFFVIGSGFLLGLLKILVPRLK
jgi:glycosyltransferase involved in cell wall biosynthesis